MSKPLVEYRIYGGKAEEAEYRHNFRQIEGMEERKQKVLAEQRARKAGR